MGGQDRGPRLNRRLWISFGGAAVLVGAAGGLFGAGGVIASGPLALLWLAVRHDNHTGSLLMLAVLVTVAVAILFGLIAAMTILAN